MTTRELMAILAKVDPELPVCVVFDSFMCVEQIDPDCIKTGKDHKGVMSLLIAADEGDLGMDDVIESQDIRSIE